VRRNRKFINLKVLKTLYKNRIVYKVRFGLGCWVYCLLKTFGFLLCKKHLWLATRAKKNESKIFRCGKGTPSQGSIAFLNGRKATVGLKQGPSAFAAAVKNL
jgi:hypothetical protein